MKLHTILGVGGVIGNDLANVLSAYTVETRLVSRSWKTGTPPKNWMKADLLRYDEIEKAVAGSEVVYLVAGIPYDKNIWKRDWPVIMTNTINACKKHGAKLVFFDNVYMYGKVDGWMTESTPINPISVKGEVRAKIADQLMSEVKAGNLQGLIARAADFYGPGATNTATHPMVFTALKNGKSAQWLGNDTVRHSFTFTPDAARATALLGNTPECFGEVWHLPTHHNALTGKEFIEEVAAFYGVKASYSCIKPWMMRMAGLFNGIARESVEMMYQSTDDYLFDSSKFIARYFEPTTYREGIIQTAKSIE